MVTYLDREKYWTYTITAFVLGIITSVVIGLITYQVKFGNYQYKLWNEYHAWRSGMTNLTLQHHLEKSLADPSYPKEWIWIPDLRKATERIRKLRNSQTLATDLQHLRDDPSMQTLTNPWMSCGKLCIYYPPIQIVDDPERLTQVFKNDERAITPLPSTTIPAKFIQIATITERPVTYFPTAWWWMYYLWFLFSAGTAVGYFIVPFFNRYYLEKEEDPLRAVPDFILGWLLFVLWLPGYLAGYLIYVLNLSFQEPISTLIPRLRQFFKRRHKDDYSTLEKALFRLKERAEDLKDEVLKREIDTALTMIRDARSRAASSELRTLQQALEGVRVGVKVQKEIDDLGRSKKGG